MAQKEQVPQWVTSLINENKGLIDSANWYNPHPDAPNYRTYVIYYNQPLYHNDPQSNRFPLRALITVDTRNDVTKAINHVYASGYAIEYSNLANPDSMLAHDKGGEVEIAKRYKANYILIEHRYFQYSAPDECWKNLDPLTAEEAAADFHNLFDGLKKVLKGKWVMSGVSKGGITTLLQHTFYPEDMDVLCRTRRRSSIARKIQLCTSIGTTTDGIKSTSIISCRFVRRVWRVFSQIRERTLYGLFIIR